jgi:hypothetical protein
VAAAATPANSTICRIITRFMSSPFKIWVVFSGYGIS